MSATPGAEALPTASAATLVSGEVRAVAATAVSAWFTHERNRRHADWRRTVTGVRDALAGLDRTCEAAIQNLTEAEAEPAAPLATLVDALVASAAANAEAAAERARADGHLEIADLQARADRLPIEIDAAREQAQIVRASVDEAQRAQGRAEAEQAAAQRAHAQLVAASEAQRHSAQTALDAERAVAGRLHQQLEAAHEERARLIAALHTVQRAISFAEPGAPPLDLPDPLPPPQAVPIHLADRAPASPYFLRAWLDTISRSRRRFWTATCERHRRMVPTDCWKRTVGRLTTRQLAILIGAIGAFALPVLTGLGARWSAQTEINHLRAVEKAMQMENGSYRAATSQLTSQIQSLESVINDLGVRTALKPVKRNAAPKLPAIVESRASGGSSVQLSAALSNPLPESLSPDETFKALHGLLRGLENRLTSIREALAAATPSVWPTRGWLTSAFGTRNDPFTGQSRHHQGVDIATEKGQPVLATADGAVESAVYAGDYGNLVVVRHEFGLSTRYGHLSRFAVKAGQNVKRGDLIGYVGSSGRSTGPHLHYEILRNDHVIDPLQLLIRHADH